MKIDVGKFASATTPLHLANPIEVGREAILEEGVTEVQFDALLDEMAVRDREGRFLAVGVMYVVVVEKR